MALGTNNIVLSAVPNFVPTIWSDEVVAAYKSNIVIAQLVRRLNYRGKKGGSITIPTPTRGTASTKAASTQVTLIAHGTDTGLTVSINKHKEYSRFVEDIVDVQALASLRRFYTDDGGYAIAKRVDRDLILQACTSGLTGGTIVEDGSTGNVDSTSTFTNARIGDDSAAWAPTSNSNAGNAVDLSDLGIRRFVKRLDSVDAPMAGRFLVVSPNIKADLMGQARFSEQAFTGEAAGSNTIRNGLVGNTYAVEVYVTNQLQQVENGGGTATSDLALMFQRDGLLLVEQMGVRTQTQYKQEWLADLFTADMIYGTAGLRPTSVIPIVVPASFTDG
jgi:hypothetical protein